MGSTALKQSKPTKRQSLKEKLGNPKFVLEQISQYVVDGDFASITDLISAYVSHCPKYANQEEFADAIGTTRQTLHRMFAHENVSLTVFFNALERIHQDGQNLK